MINDGPCYFGGDHSGEWRSCCNQVICDEHFGRIDLRAMGAGLELAKTVLDAAGIRAPVLTVIEQRLRRPR